MSVRFYDGFEFFVLAAILSAPAIWLGVTERRIRGYGIFASIVVILFVLKDSPKSILLLAAYLAYELLLVRLLLYLRSRGKAGKGIGRLVIALALLPLILSKLAEQLNIGGFAILGLSYMTFKSVQVIIEIGDGIISDVDTEDYVYFNLFFPTILCGPIDRSRRFSADADSVMPKSEYLQLLGDAMTRFMTGVLYKFVFANLLALAGTDRPYIYGVYMFFDFAGYSLMAIGLGNIWGIKTPDNFNKPWLSVDMRDFWNRWHITLSTWLRDFVFSRLLRSCMRAKLLGGDRVYQACMCLMANMLVMGVWHGLSANYIAYGLYHGVLLALTELYQKRSGFYKRHKNETAYKAVSWFITMNLVMLGFEIFAGHII